MGNFLQCVTAVDGYAVATSAPQDRNVISAVMSPIASAVDATVSLGFTVRTLTAFAWTGNWNQAPAYPCIDPSDNGTYAEYSAQWYLNQLRFWPSRTGAIGAGTHETDSVSTTVPGGAQGLTLIETITGPGGAAWDRTADGSGFNVIWGYGNSGLNPGPFPLLSYSFNSGGSTYSGSVSGTEIVSTTLLDNLETYLLSQTIDLVSTLNEQFLCNQQTGGNIYQQADTSYSYSPHGSPLAFDGDMYAYSNGFQQSAPADVVLTIWQNVPIASANYSVIGSSNFASSDGTPYFLGSSKSGGNPLLIKQNPLIAGFSGDILAQRTLVKPDQDVSYIIVEHSFCWGWNGSGTPFPLVLLRLNSSGILKANTVFELPHQVTGGGNISALSMPFTGSYANGVHTTQACISNMGVVFLAETTIEGYAAAIANDDTYRPTPGGPLPTVIIITSW